MGDIDLITVNNVSVMVRLILSVLCGGVIGLERGRAGRPAGLRTHILVCLGASLAMLTNQYIWQEFGVSDPTRMGSQVISGIGFLGAGTIIVTGKNKVKGLTTAAGLWATACMGIAIGIGFYIAGIVTCLLITFVTVVLHPLDNYMLSKSKVLDLYVELKEGYPISYIIDALKEKSLYIESIEVIKAQYTKASIALMISVKAKKKEIRLDTISSIAQIDGIEFIEDI